MTDKNNVDVYTVTHEMGHAIENSIIETERVNKHLDDSNFQKYLKFKEKRETEIFEEVKKIWKNKYTTGEENDKIFLSKYSSHLDNRAEWFAETFTNYRLAEKPAPIALALGEYLKEKNR